MPVASNQVVAIHYTLTVEDEVIDQSQEGEPLVYLHGHGNIIPGLEAALDGKDTGDKVAVVIEPANAYGDYDEALIVQIPKEAFPEGERDQITAGIRFQGPHPADQQQPALYTVLEVTEDTIVADANHMLAGKTLSFAVEIGEIRAGSEEEIAQGHVQGPEGHEH